MANQNVQDTFEGIQNNSGAAFLKYKKQIIIAVVAIIVIIGGYFLYRNLVALPQQEQANTELAKSQTLFNAQQYDNALKGFQKIQSDYSSTDAGNLANLY